MKNNQWEGDEQGERIAEEWNEVQSLMAKGESFSVFELMDIFEDRDPFEFL